MTFPLAVFNKRLAEVRKKSGKQNLKCARKEIKNVSEHNKKNCWQKMIQIRNGVYPGRFFGKKTPNGQSGLRETRAVVTGKRWLRANMAQVFKMLKGIVRRDI